MAAACAHCGCVRLAWLRCAAQVHVLHVAAPPQKKNLVPATLRPEQLEIYGIYELQVLEGLLRRPGPTQREAMELVCDRIKRKIGWDPEHWNVEPYRFLVDFYAAQRQRLEGRMLMGERREFKRTDPPPPAAAE